jgi:hypothetical protein
MNMKKLQFRVLIISSLFFLNSLLSYGQLNYTSTWVANSGGTRNTFVQMYMISATVNQAGTTAGVCYWDEGGRGLGLYNNEGNVVNKDWNDRQGGVNVGINLNYVYNAGTSSITKRAVNNTTKALKAANIPGISASWSEGDVAYSLEPEYADAFRKKMGITGVSANESFVVAAVYQLNKVFVYDTDLQLLRTISVNRPYYATPDDKGNVWVVQGADKNNAPKIVEFDTTSKATGKEITGFADPRSLQISKKGQLIVGDNGTNQQVFFYDITADPVLVETFGQKGGIGSGIPGQVKPDKFSGIVYAGTDSLDNLYVITDLEGSIIRRFDKDRNLIWQKYGLGFVDMADADPNNENHVYSCEERYSMDYSKLNGEEQEYAACTLDPYKYPDDPRIHAALDGGVWIRWINGRKFMFVGEMYSSFIYIYRFNEATDGEIAIPCGAIMRHSRFCYGLTGEWPAHQPRMGSFIWRDKNGNGKFDADEYESIPSEISLANVDDFGNIYTGGLRYYECQGLDEIGNPVYSFKKIVDQGTPQPFTNIRKAVYDSKWDAMFITGTTATKDNSYNVGPVFAVYPDWSKGNRTAAWTKAYSKPYAGFAAKGDYLFAAYAFDEENWSIDVFSAKDGSEVGNLAALQLGNIGWIDIPWGIIAEQRTNGEYLVFREDDLFAKTVLHRWNPYVNDSVSPTKPAALKLVSKTSTSVTVSFDKATDETGLSGYFVYANGTRANAKTIGTTNYIITGLEPGTSYEIYVSAADYAGHETSSDTISAETFAPDTIAPTKPEGVVAAETTVKTIQLKWNASTDNIGVTGYDIFLNNQKIGFKTIQDTVFLVSDLNPSVEYKFKLVACDFAGNVSDTSVVTISTAADIEAPTTPILYPTTQNSSSEIAINWKTSSDNSDVDYYDLYNKGKLLKGKIPAHEYLGIKVEGDYMLYKITGLDINTTYDFSLKAVDLAGNESGFSNILTMKTDTVWSRLLDIEEAYMGIGYLFYYGTNMDLSGFLFGTMMRGFMEWNIDLPMDTTYRFISHYTTEESFSYPMQIDVNGEKKAEFELKRLTNMTWWGYENDPGYVITDLKAGESLIRLTSYAQYTPNLDHVKITVSEPYVSVASISLDSTQLEMTKNETYKLIPTFTPANATDKRIVWSSSRNGTAKVDQDGVVTAAANGTATITATTVDGSKKATCVVTVGTTGIEIKEMTEDEVNIYPNPAENELFVKFSEPVDATVELRLYNAQSNMVMSIKSANSNAGDEFRFDTSALSNGVYFLRITKGGETDTRKVIISK